MNRSIRTLMTTAALAAGALAAGAASADDRVGVRVHIGEVPVYQEAPRAYVVPQRQYYAYNDDRAHRNRDRCGAERWDPNERYMPGDRVWRQGNLYRARGISAQVYNQNSPPEWTPNYWAPARC